MKKIEVSSIVPDSIAEGNFYTESGELLIAKGTMFSQKYVDALTRRNIFEVYLKAFAEEDEEIHQLLTKEFAELDDLTLDDAGAAPITKKKKPAREIRLPPELKGLKAGEEGALQLAKSPMAQELDNLLLDGFAPDRPAGMALKQMAKQILPSERTPEYVGKMTTSYVDAITGVKVILNSLADGIGIDEGTIRSVVDRFIKTYLTDKSILINITNTKAWEGEYLYHHTLNVCLLSINIAAAANYSQKQIIEIGIGALLHDVGMLLVPEEIRFKKGRLTKDEWYEVQKHAILGLHILEKIAKIPETAKFVAYQVHERENGKGYPKQRSGRLIHRYAKIVQIADIYESLCSPREYRMPYIPYRAMELLIKMSRQNLISAEFVKAFLTYASLFPIGSIIELSDHRIAKVIQGNEQHYTKPIVSVILDEKGDLLEKSMVYQVDLSKDTNIQIIRALERNNLPQVDLMFGF
jgi:HD-GYP domain-containing protein (c-di-GMP phosphodiesterase class II)